jgi:acetyl-CoA acetyltransferase/uncharacterized OB-fold protein
MTGQKSILPLVTLENEFYWTSGADGRLRFKQCNSCTSLIHPPQPICTRCRSTDLTVTAVSGLARLVGFTENHRFTAPGFSPPYVIAEVAVEEDPRVRLTTNIPGRLARDLTLGQRLRVFFENVDDVWLPLFEPVGEADPTELPPEEVPPVDVWRQVRPMVTPEKFEDKCAVTGIGMSQIGRRLMRSPLALTVEACQRAVEDAGLTLDDVDGLSTYPGAGLMAGMGEGGVTALEAALRIRPSWFNGGTETFGPGGAVIAAMLAVAAGLARHVLCFRTVWQSTHDGLVKDGRIRPSQGRVGAPMDYTLPFGALSAAHTLAQTAQRHMQRYGTTKETLGWIALNQRANATLNPSAVYRTPLTMDDYLNARTITTPFGLYDCDVPCDASIAVVVSAVDVARDLAKPPIRIEAVGTQIIERMEWDQGTLAHEPHTLGPAAHLWSRSSLTPADVDVAELYDGFTINCLSWIEALGFCGIGEAKDFLDGGQNIALQGLLPLNTHGGQLSHGRTHGMGLVHEAIVQLRGEGGARQVAAAEVAVVSSGGLTPGGAILFTTDH